VPPSWEGSHDGHPFIHKPQNQNQRNHSMNSRKLSKFSFVLMLVLSLLVTPVLFTGCAGLKPVPVAEGEDPIVVNAERIQSSSLSIYEQVIKWEFANRAVLPAEVSRAVDKFRKEFPPAWKQSRSALVQYKAGTGPDATTVTRVTAALSIVQSSLLSLMLTGSSAEIAQANNSLNSLIRSIGLLFDKPPTPPTR